MSLHQLIVQNVDQLLKWCKSSILLTSMEFMPIYAAEDLSDSPLKKGLSKGSADMIFIGKNCGLDPAMCDALWAQSSNVFKFILNFMQMRSQWGYLHT